MAEEKVLNIEPAASYDDAAEQEKYLRQRKQRQEEDFQKPFDPEAILEVRHLRKTFPMKKTLLGKVTKELVAVDDISFKLMPGETLGIVGESGCGKTTAGRAILKLHQPTGGQIIFDGEDITNYNSKQMREFRKKMQIIFQDPRHPYTIGLQKSKPTMQLDDSAELYNIPGNVPNPVNMPNHCYFKERCAKCTAKCSGEYPGMIQVSPTHFVACHLYDEEKNNG